VTSSACPRTAGANIEGRRPGEGFRACIVPCFAAGVGAAPVYSPGESKSLAWVTREEMLSLPCTQASRSRSAHDAANSALSDSGERRVSCRLA
jgi:hypothetical protein